LAHAAAQISFSSQMLATGSSKQAASLEETSASAGGDQLHGTPE
jgi:methyl-accepting chemotaxis protein